MMKSVFLCIFGVLTVSVAFASASPSGTEEAEREVYVPSVPEYHNKDVEKFVIKLANRWATGLHNHDAAGIANGYTDDAIYYEEGLSSANNKKEIMKNYINWFNDMGDDKVMIEIEGYEAMGDEVLLVWGVLEYKKSDDSPADLNAKFVTYLIRVSSDSEDLDYKISRDFTFHCTYDVVTPS